MMEEKVSFLFKLKMVRTLIEDEDFQHLMKSILNTRLKEMIFRLNLILEMIKVLKLKLNNKNK